MPLRLSSKTKWHIKYIQSFLLEHLCYVVEYIWYGILGDTGHSVRLPTACLPICEYTCWRDSLVYNSIDNRFNISLGILLMILTVNAVKNWKSNSFGSLLVHLSCCTFTPIYSVCLQKRMIIVKNINQEHDIIKYKHTGN